MRPGICIFLSFLFSFVIKMVQEAMDESTVKRSLIGDIVSDNLMLERLDA